MANFFARFREQSGIWFSRVSIILVLLFLFFIAGGGVSHKSIWRIEHVNISGASAVSEDASRSLARQKLEGNYFFVYARNNSRLFPRKEIEKMLYETFPRIANVSAKRADNHTIVIEIKERKPFALWCGEDAERRGLNADIRGNNSVAELNNCWFIDESGFVFDKSPVFSKGVYVEVYGKLIEKNVGEPLRASLPERRFATANLFTELIREDVGKAFRIFIKAEDEIEVTIHTSAKHPFLSDVVIRFKEASDPATLVKNLEKAIMTQFPNNIATKKKLLYIDMRFGSKVIFGFEN